MFTYGLSLWKRGALGSAAILGIVLISATGRSREVGRTPPQGFVAPIAVREIIRRACLDCHSDQTVWPWYSNIPPVSWQIHDDVANAREFMDLSHWSDYTAEEQHGFVSEIALATRARIMPPPRYLLLHHDAKLSDADLHTLAEWARSQAR